MIPFERYKAWEQAHELALRIYDASDGWPRPERYELTAQLRRAALSIPTNLAEGLAKHGPRERRRYLDIVVGSLSEVAYLLRFARDRKLISPEQWMRLDEARNEVGRLTWGLLQAARRAGAGG